MTRRKRRPRLRAAARARNHIPDDCNKLTFSTTASVRQTFAAWCAGGAPHQTNLDPEIVGWLLPLMAKPEGAGVDNVTAWKAWVKAHRTKLRWKSKQEWTRVLLSARALWIAYENYLMGACHES
jgi:hypothetical protein